MTSLSILKIRDVKSPIRGSGGSAGLDLHAAHETTLLPFQTQLIKTGLKIQFPNGVYGRIAPRSGLALHHNLWINGGVIDPDYSGEIGVIIMNMGSGAYTIRKNERFCQIICEKAEFPRIEEVMEMGLPI